MNNEMNKNEVKQRSKTKYQVASEILLRDIESGNLRPGDRLPSEEQLVSQLGFSLGTVQRALRDLAELGVVERIHGSGTYVSGARPPEDHLRHFRFRAEGAETLLPVFFETESLTHTESKGPWTEFLGEDLRGYVKIQRLSSVNREFKIFSELYLPATKFSSFLEIEPSDLDGVSIRDMLAEKFNTPTLKTDQFIACGIFPPRVTQLVNMPIGMFGMILTIKSETYRHVPIIWQRAFVPPSDRQMEIVTEAPT